MNITLDLFHYALTSALLTANFIVLLYILHTLRSSVTDKHVSEEVTEELEETPPVSVDEELLNEEHLEKQLAFDSRIAKLKEELASQHHSTPSKGSTADELHPLVKNIPHHSISDMYEYEREEVAK